MKSALEEFSNILSSTIQALKTSDHFNKKLEISQVIS